MNIPELLKEAESKVKTIGNQIQAVDNQLNQLNQQKQSLLAELLQLQGELRAYKKLIEGKNDCTMEHGTSVE